MGKWVAYNKLFVGGKATGREYPAASGDTREEALRKAVADNNKWNRSKKNKGYEAKVMAVKNSQPQRQKKKSTGWGFDFGKW